MYTRTQKFGHNQLVVINYILEWSEWSQTITLSTNLKYKLPKYCLKSDSFVLDTC